MTDIDYYRLSPTIGLSINYAWIFSIRQMSKYLLTCSYTHQRGKVIFAYQLEKDNSNHILFHRSSPRSRFLHRSAILAQRTFHSYSKMHRGRHMDHSPL